MIFKDGICVSSSDQNDKDKIKLSLNGKYKIFIGANGPCKVSMNVGGKIFRSHHDEVMKGLLAVEKKGLVESKSNS